MENNETMYELKIDMAGPDGNIFVIIASAHNILEQFGEHAKADRMMEAVKEYSKRPDASYKGMIEVVGRHGVVVVGV